MTGGDELLFIIPQQGVLLEGLGIHLHASSGCQPLKHRLSGVKTFPFTGEIFISGSEVLKIPFTISSRPLKTDRIVISAMVPTVTPATEMAEMTLMALRDFFANRYLFAM